MNGTAAPTRVLVHGVPETTAIWTPLLKELSALGIDNVVTLSPPASAPPCRRVSRRPSRATATG